MLWAAETLPVAPTAERGSGVSSIVLVTRSGARAFAGIMFVTGSRVVSVKLIIPRATTTAPAVAKTLILRITLFPQCARPLRSTEID